jgi:CTP:phosphocholine cytidylyltransferase-like protein
MCSICKKFKRGSISVEEAREELDEQAEFLTEEHIEDIEELLSEGEDAYDYITERKKAQLDIDDEDYEDDNLPSFDERYILDKEDD